MRENTRKGKLIQEGGKYSVVETESRNVIPINLVAGEAQLEKLVGTEVEILYSIPQPAVVGLLWPPPLPPEPPFPPCYFILCYYPPDPWWRKQISEMTPVMNETWRMEIADRLLRDGMISEEIHAKLIQY